MKKKIDHQTLEDFDYVIKVFLYRELELLHENNNLDVRKNFEDIVKNKIISKLSKYKKYEYLVNSIIIFDIRLNDSYLLDILYL